LFYEEKNKPIEVCNELSLTARRRVPGLKGKARSKTWTCSPRPGHEKPKALDGLSAILKEWGSAPTPLVLEILSRPLSPSNPDGLAPQTKHVTHITMS
jgi:hypothetical protein